MDYYSPEYDDYWDFEDEFIDDIDFFFDGDFDWGEYDDDYYDYDEADDEFIDL